MTKAIKRVDQLQKGDKICAETGETLTVKSVGHGLIRGHLSIIHEQGFSEIPKAARIETV